MMDTKSKATHTVARRFNLSELILEADQALDWTDGVLRLPPSSIQHLVDRGLIQSMDETSIASRRIDQEANQATVQANEDLLVEEAKINAAYLSGMQPLNLKYPEQPRAYEIEKGKLTVQAQSALQKLRKDHRSKLDQIESSRSEKHKQNGA
jgi:hypothetical protein